MQKPASLDELIARKAAEFADQIKAAAAMADKEEEIRIEVEKQLAFIQREAGIKLEGKHEYTVARGRIDSFYNRVIIEYKNPKSPSARIGPKADSPGTKKVVEQIKKRFYDIRSQHGQPMNSLFGVGLDGNHFVFVRFLGDKWEVFEPVEVNRHSAERFLWALFNLGQKGKPFSAEYLTGDFGADSDTAKNGIRSLYNSVLATNNPKAKTFLSQWKILFGEVCGYDVDNPSDKIKKLAEFYGVSTRNFKPAELLFAVHSYYAIFMKLLASEIVAFFYKLDPPLKNMKLANASKLKQQMEDLEAGSIFRQKNITNFFEGDIFAWYTAVWSEPIEELVRIMVRLLDNYNPGTLSEDPIGSRDLLKKLYQQLFPKDIRHDFGEYYTPDWLAEHVLNELGYVGDPDKRLLDPSCGSGTFLVMAINRIRKWYENNGDKCGINESNLCRKILSNVIGFDLNPLAVMAARTNYLIAIRDLISHVDKVEIPVYLCDSILTPSEYGELFAGTVDKAKAIKTAAARFVIPVEIAKSRDDVSKYAEQLEFCVQNSYKPDEFIQRCRDEGLPTTEIHLHIGLYNELLKLNNEKKNGVWARIIKNAFAPLFIEPVDFIAGNPPWVRYAFLPQQYRKDIEYLWKHYKLFTQKGLQSLMGTAELDFSILFTYACIDYYLKNEGHLGFLITQEVVRSKSAGEGFRSFILDSSKTPLKVNCFHDFVAVKPFPDAANKPAFISMTKGSLTTYPVPYTRWQPKPRVAVFDDDTLEHVSLKTEREQMIARPLDNPVSPWQILPQSSSSSTLVKLAGSSSYVGRCGVSVDPYGVFLCKILSVNKDGSFIIVNDPTLGDTPVSQIPPRKVENNQVYPVVRGRDIRRWSATPIYAGIILNSSTRRDDIPNEKEIRRTLPNTYAYLLKLKNFALGREKFWQFFSRKHYSSRRLSQKEMGLLGKYVRLAGKSVDGQFLYEISDAPFYALFNVGDYTFSPFKVCWPMGASSMRAAVLKTFSFEVEGGKTSTKCVIPATGTTSYVSFDNEYEAHFLCAMLNSIPTNAYIQSFSSTGRGFGAPSIVSKMRLPQFNSHLELHRLLSDLSKDCHKAALKGDVTTIEEKEIQVNECVCKLWKISKNEFDQLLQTVERKRTRGRGASK